MEPEVTPEPEDDELAAIREALGGAADEPAESAWWRAGLPSED